MKKMTRDINRGNKCAYVDCDRTARCHGLCMIHYNKIHYTKDYILKTRMKNLVIEKE